MTTQGGPDEVGYQGSYRLTSRSDPAPTSRFVYLTTVTGQRAWWTHCWLTDPSSSSLKPPRPREPTTSRSASADISTSTWAGGPSMTAVFHVDGRVVAAHSLNRLPQHLFRAALSFSAYARPRNPVLTRGAERPRADSADRVAASLSAAAGPAQRMSRLR
jgi:hypothetical protein